MKKKLAVLSTTIMLGIGNLLATPIVKASTDLQTVQVHSNFSIGISQSSSKITQARAQLAKLNEQANRTDQAISDNVHMLTNTENKIASTKTEIDQLQKQIKELNTKITKRTGILKKRALSFQEDGGTVSYLSVLLGASSFGAFIDRVSALTDIIEADNALLKQHEADKQAVDKKQASVKSELAHLTAMKTECIGMKVQLAQQKAENDQLKAHLKEIAADGLSKKGSLERLNTLASTSNSQAQSSQPSVSQTRTSLTENSSSSGAPAFVPASHASGGINTVIHAGYKYIGNSVYVFGAGRTASDVSHGRFDCSGFVHWAFSQAGVSVGSSTDSLKYNGRQVSTSQMKPGDLVFFNTYKQDGHVGIYLGSGRFIGSQSSTGVSIANLSSGYWKKHFSGRVVRIF